MVLELSRFFLHLLTNSQYGFHHDELATLDDARILAWGYVAYPPPQTLIVVGYTHYGVENEETLFHPNVFICRERRQSWPELWRSLKHYG